MATNLGEESRPYLPTMLPVLLRLFREDVSETYVTARKVLYILAALDNNLCDHLHLVIPALMRAVSSEELLVVIRISSLKTLRRLIFIDGIENYASAIIHPLVRLLASPQTMLRRDILLVLCSMVYKLTTDYIHYIPLVHKVRTPGHHI